MIGTAPRTRDDRAGASRRTAAPMASSACVSCAICARNRMRSARRLTKHSRAVRGSRAVRRPRSVHRWGAPPAQCRGTQFRDEIVRIAPDRRIAKIRWLFRRAASPDVRRGVQHRRFAPSTTRLDPRSTARRASAAVRAPDDEPTCSKASYSEVSTASSDGSADATTVAYSSAIGASSA